MPQAPTILDITEQGGGNSKLLHALLAAGYLVVSLHSIEQIPTLTEVTEAIAVVIDGKFSPTMALLAKKVKFLATEVPVLLVSSEPQSNAPPPSNVDVVAYAKSPAACVQALTSVLQLALSHDKAVAA